MTQHAIDDGGIHGGGEKDGSGGKQAHQYKHAQHVEVIGEILERAHIVHTKEHNDVLKACQCTIPFFLWMGLCSLCCRGVYRSCTMSWSSLCFFLVVL